MRSLLLSLIVWGAYVAVAQVVSGPSSAPSAGSASTSAPASQPMPKAVAVLRAVTQKVGGQEGSAELVVEKKEGGYIDWANCQVVATGTAKVAGAAANDVAMAGRAARLVAARNAVLILQGIQAGPGDIFPGLKDGQITVDTVIANFREFSSDYDPKAHTVTVKLGMTLPPQACGAGPLVFLSHHQQEAVRLAAVEAMAELDSSARRLLATMSKDDPSEKVRQAADAAMKKMK